MLNSPGLRVSHDAPNGWLYSQWRGTHDAASIKMHAEGLAACLAAQPCSKILSDHSELTGTWHGVVPWVGGYYFDRLAALGVAHFAWVCAAGYPDRTAMERACFLLPRPVVAIFSDLASAYDWLRRCPGKAGQLGVSQQKASPIAWGGLK
ncbi:hypothetical protein QMK33_03000 [Hymenobacter sp. H14-R3]|uniref:hypothetical protein n=1 Tax=Hymenobacter sp. H14-R3 TaxID=3046308 RepID=UPI0024BB8D18|nr:hypothetical protein [Hymenobacter sp. H14-R3]MDJ0364107.1 hypothetical protein [Hymenobacter sp. H14-R3]